MPLFEVPYNWITGGHDTVIVRADNKSQAIEIAERELGPQIGLEELIPDGLQIELIPDQIKQYSDIQLTNKSDGDNFEIIV